MSLIHQALKKVEARRHGYGSPDGFAQLKKTRSASRPAIIVLAVIAAASALFIYYGHFVFSTKKAPVANDAKEANAAASHQTQAPGAEIPGGPAAPEKTGRNRRGILHYRAGRYREAADEFLGGVREEPENSILHNNLGLSYLAIGMLNEAEASFKEALRINPLYPQALNNYGALLERRGETKKAAALLEKALKADEGYADAHLNLAISKEKLGDISSALDHYEKFLKLLRDEQDEEVKKKIKRLRSGLPLREEARKGL